MTFVMHSTSSIYLKGSVAIHESDILIIQRVPIWRTQVYHK